MQSPQQLLDAVKENKVKRLRHLAMLEKSQLIQIIESYGHFDSVNADITWLENYMKELEAK